MACPVCVSQESVLVADTLPFTLTEIQVRLRSLVAYGIHIFVADANGNISLWTKHSGLNPTGLDYLIEIGKEYYARRQRDKILKQGDRVAILGRGIAVVEQVGGKWIQAVVLNRCVLRIPASTLAGRTRTCAGKRVHLRVSRQTKKPERTHCSFAYSALASFRMGNRDRHFPPECEPTQLLPILARLIASPEPARSGLRR
jgi:hypothetical protein